MNKNELHDLIAKTLIETSEAQKNAAASTVGTYRTTIIKLQELDGTIDINMSKKERDSMYGSFSGFYAKELSPVNPQLAKHVANAVFNYAKTFDLIDPYTLKLLSSKE